MHQGVNMEMRHLLTHDEEIAHREKLMVRNFSYNQGVTNENS